ncbi:MAG: hypothetical protein WCT29_03350 [Candidatus Paceibacterota bacterium]|jgi:hypothetical protein
MKLKLTRHVQDMISCRGINLDHIKQTLRNPDTQEETFAERVKVSKNVGEKTIEVIYYKEAFKDKGDEYLIITAYYLE